MNTITEETNQEAPDHYNTMIWVDSNSDCVPVVGSLAIGQKGEYEKYKIVRLVEIRITIKESGKVVELFWHDMAHNPVNIERYALFEMPAN